jgi:rhamnosyltransferase subunit B
VPSDSHPQRQLDVLLPTLGSSGDVHPFIGLGVALRRRGHRATIITNPYFQPLIEAQGLEFLPVGRSEDVTRIIAHPDLWHARRGFEVIARELIVPAIDKIYRLIESRFSAHTVVAASSISLGARLAQERLGIPTASVHLQPIVIRSCVEQGMFGTVRVSRSQPMWFKRALFRLVDWLTIDPIVKPPLNALRASLGLRPVERVLDRWLHSPQCVIAFFPEWFAGPQPDWPPNTHEVGFPLWDGGEASDESAALREFLEAGAPPVIFTAGSAASTMQRYFHESVEAVRRLGARAMLVTNYPQQLPRDLPPGVRAFGYLPFSAVLPHAALMVYHGGIGTLAQTVKAGIPHLVVPSAHDQFDNGWRIGQFGLGRSVPQTRYDAARAAREIDAILHDAPMRERCREWAVRIDSSAALARACELIEGLRAH